MGGAWIFSGTIHFRDFWRTLRFTLSPTILYVLASNLASSFLKKTSSGYLDNLITETLIYCNLLYILFSVVQGENDERNKKGLSSSKGK